MEIDAKAACEIEETKTKKDARFEYVVTLDPNYGKDQTYEYLFTPDGETLSGGGYDVVVDISDVKGGLINRAGQEVDNPKNISGTLGIGAGVSQFTVNVDIKAKNKLTGNESLEFQLKGLEGTDETEVIAQAVLNPDLCNSDEPNTRPDNKPNTGNLIVEGSYECGEDYLKFDIQTKPQKGDMNVLLELNSTGISAAADTKAYTEYLEVNNGRTDAQWTSYQPASEVNLGVEGSLQARVKIDDIRKAGLEEPAELTFKAQEIIFEEPGIPIIDVNYRQLNIDNARAGKNSSKSPKTTMNNVANQEGVYYYDKILEHEGGTVGAKVTWKASAGVKQLRFDDWSGNKGARERFQPIITSKNNNQKGGTVHFSWQFFYVGDDNLVNDGDQEVALGRFWMNPIDLDGE